MYRVFMLTLSASQYDYSSTSPRFNPLSTITTRTVAGFFAARRENFLAVRKIVKISSGPTVLIDVCAINQYDSYIRGWLNKYEYVLDLKVAGLRKSATEDRAKKTRHFFTEKENLQIKSTYSHICFTMPPRRFFTMKEIVVQSVNKFLCFTVLQLKLSK